ncbi:MAG: hypothetical protein P8P30_00080 [Rickettsiales bacterium]|nr:hypothetical protein [Rickettsiales bacterium]
MSDGAPKVLKVTVISVGIMLIGGFLWVGAVVAKRASESAVAITQSPTRAVTVNISDCPEVTLPRPSGAKIAFNSGEWHVTTSKEIRRYSECGELLQKVLIKR